MASAVFTDRETALRMGRIRQRDTAPEVAVRQMLYRLGARYRIGNRDLPGSPDIANRSRLWAIFVHGCYWHHHEGCYLATIPKRNRTFWLKKFADNQKRDARNEERLKALGYTVLIVWQCELDKPSRLRVRLKRFVMSRDRGRNAIG